MRILLSLMFFAAAAMASQSASGQDFSGEFTQVTGTSAECTELFSPSEYNAIHRRFGSTGRQSVWSFRRDDDTGFFHSVIMVSLYGPDGDVYYEEDLIEASSGDRVEILAEGFVVPNVVLLDFVLKRFIGETDEERCQATATFSAFQ